MGTSDDEAITLRTLEKSSFLQSKRVHFEKFTTALVCGQINFPCHSSAQHGLYTSNLLSVPVKKIATNVLILIQYGKYGAKRYFDPQMQHVTNKI